KTNKVRHIPRVLYHYLYSDSSTQNQTRERIEKSIEYIGQEGLRCFYRRSNETEILIEESKLKHVPRKDHVMVRDKHLNVLELPRGELRVFHTIRRPEIR